MNGGEPRAALAALVVPRATRQAADREAKVNSGGDRASLKRKPAQGDQTEARPGYARPARKI